MTARLEAALAAVLGQPLAHVAPVSGGDIHSAYAVTLSEGSRVFVKTSASDGVEVFRTEARGLAYLAESGALSTPRVLGFGAVAATDTEAGFSYLALEWLEPRARVARFDELLGRGLAKLHRFGAARFGFEEDNFIGRLPQCNRAHKDFVSFYREQRLLPHVRRAHDAGYFDAATVARFERLYERLPQLLGPEEPPARLHGDLWGGNCLVGPDGAPWLIDPAVYGGHREIDLAMMQLFGGFSAAVFDSYAEAFPLADGHEDRVDLMQLYPLLVHVNHFGQGYVSAVRRVLARYT